MIDLNMKQWNHTVFKYNLFLFLFTFIAVGYNWQWRLHCEFAFFSFFFFFFFYSHTRKEYSTCMWRLQYMLGTRYAQYMLWDVTTIEWLNKRKSGPWHRNACTAPLVSDFTDSDCLRSPVCFKGIHDYWQRPQCTFSSLHLSSA